MPLALLETLAILCAASVVAGVAGSVLGIGGGVFLIPFMTLVLGVDTHTAIATSLIGVIATSSGAAAVYVRDRLTNLRLGMFLEIATTIGAIGGALAAVSLNPQWLDVGFGVMALYASVYMIRTRETARDRAYRPREPSSAPKRLSLDSLYFDAEDGGVYRYRVERRHVGLGVSAVAGAASGLLGVGGGFIKVPAMATVMRVPMKVAVATSNFMIGVTAAASAFIYYSRGFVNPALASIVIVGVFAGTNIGTRLMVRARPSRLQLVFGVVLAAVGVAMALRGFGILGVGL